MTSVKAEVGTVKEVTIGHTTISKVANFKYMGSIIKWNVKISNDASQMYKGGMAKIEVCI